MIGQSHIISPQSYNRGLEGFVAGDTKIGYLDGQIGRLVYRGYPVEELAVQKSFEEVTYLIINGELPNSSQQSEWNTELKKWRNPPKSAFKVLDRIPENAHPLAQFRTMMTVAACLIPEAENLSIQAQWRRPARILAWTSSLAAGAIRHLKGLDPVPPRDDLGYCANFLYQSLGHLPSEEDIKAFEMSMIVQADHGLHAAAFAALIVISTGADLGSAVLAGMGALSGIRHGGANQLSFEMLKNLKDPDDAVKWAKKALEAGYRFPGYGHRVYKCPDPRVKVLEPYAEKILKSHGKEKVWQKYLALRETIEASLSSKGIYANVDSITGLIYEPLGLPIASFPIPFCLSIQTGWMAHCLEYLPDGRMIEPGSVYIGNT
jgi:2-methylcitrate synthase